MNRIEKAIDRLEFIVGTTSLDKDEKNAMNLAISVLEKQIKNNNNPIYVKKVDIYLRDSDGYKIKDILVNVDENTANETWDELIKTPPPPYRAYQWKERYERIN